MRCFRGNKFITSRIQNKNGYIDADSHRFTGIVFNQGHSALLFPHSKLNGHFVYNTNVPAINDILRIPQELEYATKLL